MIHDSLMESRVRNSTGNYVVDAKKYLDILGAKQAKKSYQKTTPSTPDESEKTTYNDQSDISDIDFLVNKGIIVKRETTELYRLHDSILRQEIIGIAMKIRDFKTPT